MNRLSNLKWILMMAMFAIVALSFGQGYRPKAGETVLKLNIEGRGSVFILLNTRQAPKTTAQIIRLAKSGFYDGQKFHRVIKSPKPYLVQIGDPASKTRSVEEPSEWKGGSGTRIGYEESGMQNKTGAVGLAMDSDERTGDSQFYILLSDAGFLNGKYTVFGQVVEGMEVVKQIEKGDRVTSASILGG